MMFIGALVVILGFFILATGGKLIGAIGVGVGAAVLLGATER